MEHVFGAFLPCKTERIPVEALESGSRHTIGTFRWCATHQQPTKVCIQEGHDP